MKELIVASRNNGKLKEINELLKGVVTTTLSLQDFPDLPEIEEDGLTFEENAIKKAKITCLATGKPVIADDSGLMVEALGGKPGVYSARFAGNAATDEQNNEKLLRDLTGIPAEKRLASFQCIIALYKPDGSCITFSGELQGLILESPRGSGGFGYDPLFLVREYGKTLAELSPEIKNRISHRGKALNKLKSYLSDF